MDGHEQLNGRGQNDNDMDPNDPLGFEHLDLTNAYEEHDVHFRDIDNSQKARAKREGLRHWFFRNYSDKMTAVKRTYDVNDEKNKTGLKNDMENREVSKGFLEMDADNPMMAFATEVSESVNEPPYFETHINESSHGRNVANISQHSFVRFHATVYNRELRRMIRYVFAVGHHQSGLQNDYGYASTIAMRKEVTYQDVKKGFAFINRYRINRNEDWKLFTTNCNRFAKSVADSMGFHDMSNLHDTVSCVGSFNKIRKAMYQQLVAKNKDLEFFSMEQFSKEEMASMTMPEQKGDVQSDTNTIEGMEVGRKGNTSGVPYQLLLSIENGLANTLIKELKVNSIEDLMHVKEEYESAVGQKKFVWFKKKKQRQIAVYEAYQALKVYAHEMFDNTTYDEYFKELEEQAKEGTISQKEYEMTKDQYRTSIFKKLMLLADNLILATKGLKETSIKALKLKGDIMGYKAMTTNEGDTTTISHQGFGNYHAYALDKFMEEDINDGVYKENEKVDNNDKKANQIAEKMYDLVGRDIKKEKNIAVNGHFILQRIMEREGTLINMLPDQGSDTPINSISEVFKRISEELEQGAEENQKLRNYIQMLVERKAGYTSSSEVMAWTMVQFVIMAVKDLWKIHMKNHPLRNRDAFNRKEFIENFFDVLYLERMAQASKKGEKVDNNEKLDNVDNNAKLNEEEKSKYRTQFTGSEFLNSQAGVEKDKVQEIQGYINGIYDKLKVCTDSVLRPA